ncbi:MAG: GumC family protein, partial [Flavobacteriaceae bacterium]
MNSPSERQEDILSLFFNKLYPFWPLFLVLILLGLLGAWVYLKVTTPYYETSLALIIHDENKGVDDSKIIESTNVFTSKKIVENEVEVLRSKELINEVVERLELYAPIYEEGLIKDLHSYEKCPLRIQVRDPFDESTYENGGEYAFSYHPDEEKVTVWGKRHPLHSWIPNPHGGSDIRFVPNEKGGDVDGMNGTGYYFKLVHPKVVADGLSNQLEVLPSSKLSTVVRLNYYDPNPKRGVDFLNNLIYSYRNMAMRDRDTLAANTLKFIENRMEQVGEQLASVEKELEEYRSEHGLIDLGEQGNLYLQNVGEYDRRIADIDLRLSVLAKVENYVISKNKRTGIVPSTLGLDDPILSQLLQKLYDAEIEYEELRKTTAENNPMLLNIQNKIDGIRPSILENVRNQKTNLITSRSNLYSNSNKYNSALQVLPEQERKLIEITRQKASISELYDFLVKKREETALSYAPTAGDFRIIEKAESSLNPEIPKKPFVYLTGMLLSLGLGLFLVVKREFFSSKILFRTDIEKHIGVPIVGELAHVRDLKKNTPGEDSVLINDQFKQVISHLGLYRLENPDKVVMVTSSIAGEGKSYVSSALSRTMASYGKRTVLLDLDLRNGGSSNNFGFAKNEGVVEFLREKIEYGRLFLEAEVDGLIVVPSGERTQDSSQLLASERFRVLMENLRKDYDYIIVDTPPMDLVSDAEIINEYCDQTLYVIRHDVTPKFIVRNLYQNIGFSRLKKCFLIYNGLKPRGIVEQNYGYGYGYGAPLKKRSRGIWGYFNNLREYLVG